MKIFIISLFVKTGINSVYCTYIGNFFTSNYDKLNEEIQEIRTYINYLEYKLNYTENKLNYTKNLIMIIQKNMNKKPKIDR